MPPEAETESDQACQAAAAAALAMCCAGDVEGGLARYQAVLGASAASHAVPIGLHARILEAHGLVPLANTLRQIGASVGADLSLARLMDAPAQRAVDEYRELFACGHVNAQMVANFLRRLDELGQIEELTARLDADGLIRVVSLPDDGRWSAIGELLASGTDGVVWQEAVQSVRKMHFVGGLHAHPHSLIRDLMAALGREIETYLAAWRRSERWTAPWIPRRPALNAWATLSRGEGYTTPHLHPRGWVTGVCFIAAPAHGRTDADAPGALRIGAPAGARHAAAWPDRTIAAEPGVLVLMPSYFTHWTNPVGAPGLRIAVAVDVSEAVAA
ncbi:MAG TPA: putative 2OG-Fe(II) oxygenase [Caulobacteraceae bacterium]|nr:putative 2OG-Fe(II) oxygenase [Caulobacteraceae bacterium]